MADQGLSNKPWTVGAAQADARVRVGGWSW